MKLYNIEHGIVIDYNACALEDTIPIISGIKVDLNNNKLDEKPISFIELDELIVPAIFELNRKGYRTSYCCSGHIGGPYEGYIKFTTSLRSLLNKDAIKETERLFDLEEAGFIIRVKNAKKEFLSEVSIEDSMKIIYAFINDLNKWAASLPNLKEDK